MGRTKERVVEALRQRYSLRVHMFFIVSATMAAGLVATKLLYEARIDYLPLRYAAAVGFAYVTFLLLIRMWLALVANDPVTFDGDGLDFSGPLPVGGGGGGSSDVAQEVVGGGGRFGGGGASGSWGSAVPSAGKSSSSFNLFDGVDDDFALILLILLLALVLIAAALWIIYFAPAILGDAAFQAGLAAALAKKAKKMSTGGWIGSVFRATAVPFLLVFALSITLGWYVHKHCPAARRIRDAMHCAPS